MVGDQLECALDMHFSFLLAGGESLAQSVKFLARASICPFPSLASMWNGIAARSGHTLYLDSAIPFARRARTFALKPPAMNIWDHPQGVPSKSPPRAICGMSPQPNFRLEDSGT
jgi:hypothetical protein